MDIDDAVKLGFANCVNFSDRACRSEYWYFFLFYNIGMLASVAIDTWINHRLYLHPGHNLATAVRGRSAASRPGSQRLVGTAGLGPGSRVDHPARLVLHKGHRWSEPLRPGPAGQLGAN
jgi:hypothetical protein